MDCLSSEDLKGRRRNSLCLTAYAESCCCQVVNVLGRATTFSDHRSNNRRFRWIGWSRAECCMALRQTSWHVTSRQDFQQGPF